MPLIKPYTPILQSWHPAARALLACWPMWAGGGSSSVDIVKGTAAAHHANTSWGISRGGIGVDTTSAGMQVTETLFPLALTKYTFAMFARMDTLAENDHMITQGWTTNYAVAIRHSTSAFRITIGTTTIDTSAHGLSAGDQFALVVAVNEDSNSTKAWLDGRSILNSGSAISRADAASGGVRLCARNNSTDRTFPGVVNLLLVASRAWDAGEAIPWTLDPFAMLRPRRRAFKAPAAAAAGNPWYVYANAS